MVGRPLKAALLELIQHEGITEIRDREWSHDPLSFARELWDHGPTVVIQPVLSFEPGRQWVVLRVDRRGRIAPRPMLWAVAGPEDVAASA